MIFYVLAAQIGAAQEAIVIYEGAETNHFVENHSENDYDWEVFEDFNPDIEADPTDYYFVTDPVSNSISLHWVQLGLYYLKVTETDPSGCSNIKAIAITVLPNERSIGFDISMNSSCFNISDNSFEQAINVSYNNNGLPIDSIYYPLTVEFTVNNENHSQLVEYHSQVLQIHEDWFDPDSTQDFNVNVQIISATDIHNSGIPPDIENDEHNLTIFAHPVIEFTTSSPEIYKGSSVEHIVQLILGDAVKEEYAWNVIPSTGTSTDLKNVVSSTATILWDEPLGTYTLEVFLVDGNNCVSDTIFKEIKKCQPMLTL